MKLGISKSLKHTSPEDWAQKHLDQGLDTVIFPLDCTFSHEQIAAYHKAAVDFGLTIAEVGIWESMLCADPDKRARNMDYVVSQIQMSDEIGAKCCVTFCGTYMGVRTEDSDLNFTEEAYLATVEAVKTALNRANATKTKFCLEAMRNSVPYSPENYLKFINDVDHPSLGVHLDPYNMIMNPAELKESHKLLDRCFDLLGPRIASCHFKDLVAVGDTLEERMCGKGQFDNAHFIKRLSEYPDVPLIIEHLQSTEEYLEAVALTRRLHGI